MLKSALKEVFRKLGLDVVRFPQPLIKNRIRLVRHHNIQAIIDVGASVGQYASEMMYYGYKGEIYSFEPIPSIFQALQKKASMVAGWKAYNYALGNTNEKNTINITNQVTSSSLLDIKGGHMDLAGGIFAIKKEEIQVRRLDDIWSEVIQGDYQNILLKIDTQGYEKEVLSGAEKSISKIRGIQLEMSLKELYQGAWLFQDVLKYMSEKKFTLKALEPTIFDEQTGELLEMDGIFYRE